MQEITYIITTEEETGHTIVRFKNSNGTDLVERYECIGANVCRLIGDKTFAMKDGFLMSEGGSYLLIPFGGGLRATVEKAIADNLQSVLAAKALELREIEAQSQATVGTVAGAA